MEQNKYIYVGNGQVARPLQTEPPVEINQWGGSIRYLDTRHYDFVLSKWKQYLKTLPRIEYLGEPLKDGQILEEGKDIVFVEDVVRIRHRTVAVPMLNSEQSPEISDTTESASSNTDH